MVELKPGSAIQNLQEYQRQLDADGTFVGVSRQALDEVLAYVTRPPADEALATLQARGDRLAEALGQLELGDVIVPRRLADFAEALTEWRKP